MTSHTTERFRESFLQLPGVIQRQAREAYRLFLLDPFHPSLHFRVVHPTRPIYSARIGMAYRALGLRNDDAIVWFWIGSHAEYDRLLANL